MLAMLVIAMATACTMAIRRARLAEAELKSLRSEFGYLDPAEDDTVAAARIAVDEPLVWRARVRVPEGQTYRVAYSARWLQATTRPDWFAAQPIPSGESVVTVRVMKDPRDDRWRISVIVRQDGRAVRTATVLPDELVAVFQGSHDIVSGGVGSQTSVCEKGQSMRIFNERYFVGGSAIFYGDQEREPESDVVGVFAELQPDVGSL